MMCDQQERKKRWMTRGRRSWNDGDQPGLYEPGQGLVLRPHRTSKQNTKEEARKAVYVCLYIQILAHPLNIPVTQGLTFTLDLLLTVTLSYQMNENLDFLDTRRSSPSFSWAHVDGWLWLWIALHASTPPLPRGRVHSMAQEDWT